MEACLNPGVLKVIYFIKLIMNIIFIIVPIGLIVMGSIDLSKSVTNSEEQEQKKNLNLFLKRLLFSIILFAVPWIVNVFMSLLGSLSDNVNYIDCFVNANPTDIKKAENGYGKGKNKNLEEIIENHKNDVDSGSTSNGGKGNSGTASSKNNNDKNLSPTDKGKPTRDSSRENIIYIGDSRTVHIFRNVFATASGDGCSVSDGYGGYYLGCKFNEKEIGFAKSGEGYGWLSGDANSKIKETISNNPNSYVAIYLGVNDFYNVENYANFYNSLVNDYPNIELIIVSVTQIDDVKAAANGYTARNSDVVNFNSRIKSKLNNKIKYCDVYSRIDGKFKTTDGIHYESEISKLIYNEIKNCL